MSMNFKKIPAIAGYFSLSLSSAETVAKYLPLLQNRVQPKNQQLNMGWGGEQSQSPGSMNGLWRWADASARDRARVGARVGGWA